MEVIFKDESMKWKDCGSTFRVLFCGLYANRFCCNCGKSYIPNAKYCHGCGKSVNRANSVIGSNRVRSQGHPVGE